MNGESTPDSTIIAFIRIGLQLVTSMLPLLQCGTNALTLIRRRINDTEHTLVRNAAWLSLHMLMTDRPMPWPLLQGVHRTKACDHHCLPGHAHPEPPSGACMSAPWLRCRLVAVLSLSIGSLSRWGLRKRMFTLVMQSLCLASCSLLRSALHTAGCH